MRYSDQIIEEVRLRSSLAELVSERTEVKRSGSSIVACCPFHSEKTPSFNINEEQGLYYCFGCGKKGNTFTFIMETRGLSFPESVRYLAQKTGVTLPVATEPTQFEKGLARRKQLLGKILFETQSIYEDILWSRSSVSDGGSNAREILLKRDITDQTIKRYRLGFTGLKNGYLFPTLKKLISQTIPVREEELLEAVISLGLLKKYSGNRTGELFRERIMFPISRSDGNPIAFGGRTVRSDSDIPKYINSPESPVYEKRRSFYGLPQALASIQKSRTAYIVEGYTDVLSFHQAGLENTLAVCGTALTTDHTRILSRFITRAYLVFDSDPAGRMASANSFIAFMNSGIEAIPVFLPEGEDPDSIARSVFNKNLQSDDLLKILKDGETSLLKIFLQSSASSLLGHERGTLADFSELKASEHGKLAEIVAPQLSQIKNPVERELRIKEATDLLGVSEQAFRNIIRGNSKNITGKSFKSVGNSQFKDGEQGNTVKETDKTFSETTSVFPRRLDEIKKQIIVAVLVDPLILKNEAVYRDAIIISEHDEGCRYFFDVIFRMINSDQHSPLHTPVKGLSVILSKTVEEVKTGRTSKEVEEVIAQYHAILAQCGIEKEGFIEEAVKQVTLGGTGYDALIGSLNQTVERINLDNKVDTIRMREAKSETPDEKMKLIQEKLMTKRSIQKLKNK